MTTSRYPSRESELASLIKENEALQQQHLVLRTLLEKVQSENARYRQRVEQLTVALQERDKQLSDMQQFEYRYKCAKENSKELEGRIEKEQHALADLQDEKKQFESTLTEHQQRIKQFEHVVQFLRTKAETSHLESKQLQDDLKKAHEDAGKFNQLIQAKEERISELQVLLEKEKTDQTDAQQELQTIQQQWKQLQEAVHNAQNQVALVKEEERQNRQKVVDDLEHAKQALDEKEQSIRLAQQHLAKKLKEMGIMIEKHEEQQRIIQEQQKTLSESKTRINELQARLDGQSDQEKRLREQLQEHAKLGDAAVRKWEEKYFQLYDRFQEVEARNKELRAMEDKYAQVQVVLNNLGALAAPQMTPAAIMSRPIEAPQPRPMPIEKAIPTEEHSLFDAPKMGSRFKQNLFE